MPRLLRFLPPLAAILLGYGLFLRSLWLEHDGLLLTSADDASRLLIAHAWGKYGIFPLHWTWPPLPMLVDGVLVFLGGDAIVFGAVARIAALIASGVLLALFWQRAFSSQSTIQGSAFLVLLLWLFFPVNVRLALSGLSEPYLYLLLAIGFVAWQSERLWLAGLAFGASVWCRYEGALAVALLSAWIVCRIARRAFRGAPAATILRDAIPLIAAVTPPLLWLAMQWAKFGDPLFFVQVTRAVVAEEALLAHGQTTRPIHRMLETLQAELWGWPVCLLAALGLLRLLRENRPIAGAAGAFLVLYAGMAAVSIGGRMQFYFNLFSIVVLPLAVKGGELLLVGLLRLRPPAPVPSWRLASARALLAIGAFLQVTRLDVPEIEQTDFGAWLSPENRKLFLTLRQLRDSRPRNVVVLQAAGLGPGEPHTWDPIALQLADPEHAIVLPYRHALVPGASLTPWHPELEAKQEELLRDPARLHDWAESQGFSRILSQDSTSISVGSESARIALQASY